MNPIIKSFSFHVDASLFGFRWTDAQYINVEYCANENKEVIVVSVTNITAPPYLLSMIVLQGNWMRFTQQIDAAARHNAEKHFQPEMV